jgi:hypothetical protein
MRDGGLQAPRTNCVPGVATGLNTQIGLYETVSSGWAPGDYLQIDCSELTIAKQNIAVIEPSDNALDQWFSQLRSRF